MEENRLEKFEKLLDLLIELTEEDKNGCEG